MDNKVEVCTGPLCSSSGGADLLIFLRSHPECGSKFEARECECIGDCSQSPVVFINGDNLSEVTTEILEEEIANL